MSRIHSTSERKNPPDFRWEGAKCEFIFSMQDFFFCSRISIDVKFQSEVIEWPLTMTDCSKN
ncbi:hypothetical protein B9L21_06230 [Geobacillus uzenensis]|uniref:Uncharacterized protein n=1 Tax=Geobacillus uzenensis TaxID=129339 RepID=A0ABX4DJ54_9BACL|nr:hypothetical protein B9L21_06230 [Geobacillus uzenensis]